MRKSLEKQPAPATTRTAYGLPFYDRRARSPEPGTAKNLPLAIAGPFSISAEENEMTPNQVTAARVLAAFAAVATFAWAGRSLAGNCAAVLLTIAAIALDGLDGYLARTRGLATPLGAQLDILGDRVVENLFFTFFAVSGLVSLWVPVLFFVRGALTDFLRGLASLAGRSGFGRNSMLESWWGRAFVASRASRVGYAALKCVCFCGLGIRLSLEGVPAAWSSAVVRRPLSEASQALVVAAVIFCVLRAIPVVWEGRRYFSAAPKSPSAIAFEGTR